MEWRVWITWWSIFCIKHSRLFWIYLKKHETVTDNPSTIIYVNKNRVTFKIKTGYYLELLTAEKMKLLRSTKSNITKDENCKNVSHWEIFGVVLFHCNIVNNDYQQNSRVLHTFFLINSLVNY